MELIWWVVVFVSALYVLLQAADYFIAAAEKIGNYYEIPQFVIGATLVAFGTSLPELATSMAALFKGNSEIVTANVVGSNISNILLIGGIAILVSREFKVNYRKQRTEYLILFFTSIILIQFLWDQRLTLFEAAFLTFLLIAYIVYIIKFSKSEDEEGEKGVRVQINWTTFLVFLLSGFLVVIGSNYTIESIISISVLLGMDPELIALTAVALGTSLPELAVTISCAKKGLFSILIGNIIGSNIFNTFCVIGIPGITSHLIKEEFVITDVITHFSNPIMLLATVLFILLGLLKSTPKYFGLLFLLLWMFFVAGALQGNIDLFEIVGIPYPR